MIDKSSGSWACTCISTGVTWETFSYELAKKADETNCIMVENIIDYLGRINQEIKNND